MLASLTAGTRLQIAMGLRIYFDKALPQQLLYASEREQADEARIPAWLPSSLQERRIELVSDIQLLNIRHASSNACRLCSGKHLLHLLQRLPVPLQSAE